MNNGINIGNLEHKDHLQRKFGATPGFVIIGFLAWVIKVFIGVFANHDNISIIFELSLILFSFYSCAYISKLIYLHCEEKNLGIFGSSSKLLGIVISISVFLLLNIFVKI